MQVNEFVWMADNNNTVYLFKWKFHFRIHKIMLLECIINWCGSPDSFTSCFFENYSGLRSFKKFLFFPCHFTLCTHLSSLTLQCVSWPFLIIWMDHPNYIAWLLKIINVLTPFPPTSYNYCNFGLNNVPCNAVVIKDTIVQDLSSVPMVIMISWEKHRCN